MKLLILLAFVASSAVAAKGDILLHCTRTNFSDLNQIIITEGHNKASEVVVTEINAHGSQNVYTREVSSMKNLEIELSDWHGYSRRLFNDGYGWTIEHRDECSGGYGSVVCD